MGEKWYFLCMKVQREGCQGGNLMKTAIFSMEIRAYLNWIEIKNLHWKQVFTGMFYPWLSADKRILRADHQYNTEVSQFHLLAPFAKINPRPTLPTPPQFYVSFTWYHLMYGVCRGTLRKRRLFLCEFIFLLYFGILYSWILTEIQSPFYQVILT